MLVLSRKKGQRILIGNGVAVEVLEVRGDRVRLGFEGPSDVAIHRQEVADRIARETGRGPTEATARCRVVGVPG